MSNFNFGYIKSPNDYRDWMYRSIYDRIDLPAKHIPERLPVVDQGAYGTCVGFAGAYVKRAQERVNHAGRNYEFSPAYLYSECKKIDGIPNQEGTYLRTAFKVLSEKGICREQLMPYSTMDKKLPTASKEAHEDAKRFIIDKGYAKLMSLEDIKQAIITSHAVMAGVIVTESFLEPENGFIHPVPNGRWLGGHAITILGWDDNLEYTYKDGKKVKGCLLCINSWGKNWGDEGYMWIPYDFYHFREEYLKMPFFDEAWAGVDVIMPNKNADKVELWLNSTRAIIDGEEIQLEQPPVLESTTNRTLLPVRFLSEVFGYKVEWDGATKKITITKPE